MECESPMGIDFLDLSFRLEKRFGVELRITVWEEVICRRLGKPFDISAGEVCAVVAAQLEAARRAARAVQKPAEREGKILEYRSAAGAWSGFEGDPWLTVRDEIAATLSVPAEAITRESWLRRDLGME